MTTSVPHLLHSAALAAVDERARVTAMVDAHYDVIWRTLRRLGVDAHAADDAAQQTFLVAARRVKEVREGEEKQFLYGVAVRVASEFRRSHRRRTAVITGHEPPDVEDASPDAEHLLHRKRQRETADEILAELEPPIREAFVLFEIEGLTAPEIASALGIAAGTVASRVRRGRELFRAALLERERSTR